MPSPFPGMDPYLEDHWADVHQALITYARDWLQPQLPRDLRARIEERVFVESPDWAPRAIYPDVLISERPKLSGGGTTAAVASDAEPIVVHLPAESITESFLEIRTAGAGHAVITTIEFLSVTNKLPGPGHEQFVQKQKDLRSGGVNVVEVDLVRRGRHALSVPEAIVPAECRTPYRACVWRAAKPTAFELYRAPLQKALPSIRVPLRPEDDDVLLDLQALIAQCYERGGYDDLDYTRELEPPLSPTDASWAAELLQTRRST